MIYNLKPTTTLLCTFFVNLSGLFIKAVTQRTQRRHKVEEE
jgi:hypothetical protein